MKSSRANVVNVASQSAQTSFLLIIPDFHKAVITAWYEQGQLGMEIYASDTAVVLLV